MPSDPLATWDIVGPWGGRRGEHSEPLFWESSRSVSGRGAGGAGTAHPSIRTHWQPLCPTRRKLPHSRAPWRCNRAGPRPHRGAAGATMRAAATAASASLTGGAERGRDRPRGAAAPPGCQPRTAPPLQGCACGSPHPPSLISASHFLSLRLAAAAVQDARSHQGIFPNLVHIKLNEA